MVLDPKKIIFLQNFKNSNLYKGNPTLSCTKKVGQKMTALILLSIII